MAQNQNQITYLTRVEVSTLLKISLVTLWRRTKEKKLQSYLIGNRILYKTHEVHNSLTKLNC